MVIQNKSTMQMHCMDKVSVANLYIFNCAHLKKKKKSHTSFGV